MRKFIFFIQARRARIPGLIAGFSLLILFLIIMVRPVAASPDLQITNDACLGCHTQPNMLRPLPSGEKLLLTIDESHFADSVHGNLACTNCHSDLTGFPHPDLEAQSLRDVSMQLYTVCKNCHTEQYNQTLDSVHQKALAGGNTNAAICTDCHNPHTQAALTDLNGKLLPEARLQIPDTCARCHSAIYQQYKESVHGAALTGEDNPDVPTCIDCHGVHGIEDPLTAAFRLDSPTEMCGKCHTDSTIMDQYGISTNVLNTYVADFHGTTITLFEQTAPDQAVNKPVCFDCHGVHSIKRTDDPVYGLAMKENLLTTCQKCHPDASANFPSAWMSHYIPNQEEYPIVYYVNVFYMIFIPVVLGGMSIYVITDIVRRLLNRRKGTAHK